MYKVSVIIPVYNVEKYIESCLESVLSQSYYNYEIICVDDCGQDKSMDIVRQKQACFPDKIRIVDSEKNVGLGGARDKGILYASGDYITFLDSDDYIKKDYIQTYIEAAEKGNADIICGSYIRDLGGKKIDCRPKNREKFSEWVDVSACTKFYKREFLLKNHLNFHGIRIYEDELFMYRILLKSPVISWIDYSGYYYRLNTGSITKKKSIDRSHVFLNYAENIRGFISEHSQEIEQSEILKYCLASGLTANLLYNGQKSGWKRMGKLYQEYDRLLMQIDQRIQYNKFVGLAYLKSEPAKKRYAMWLMMHLRRVRCDKIIVLIIGIL